MRAIHTRENMSPELKKELELIEDYEEHLMFLDSIKEAFEDHEIYVTTDRFCPPKFSANVFNPFAIVVVCATSGDGEVKRIDLREDLLERFDDDPDYYKEAMIKTEKAMRDFADELKVKNAAMDK